MRIKEAEEKTGISAKNIRFYEEQGLLQPVRNAGNQYRAYSQADIEHILLIKALRKLDMPLPLVARVLRGEASVSEAAQEHSAWLETEQVRLEAALAVCRELAQEDGAPDANRYLALIARREHGGGAFRDLTQDYLAVCHELAQQELRFCPKGIITAPREFTSALLAYAAERGLDITILRESLHPRLLLNGAEYEATRFNYGIDQQVILRMTHPESVQQAAIAPKRRRKLQRLHMALTLLGTLAVIALFMIALYGL